MKILRGHGSNVRGFFRRWAMIEGDAAVSLFGVAQESLQPLQRTLGTDTIEDQSHAGAGAQCTKTGTAARLTVKHRPALSFFAKIEMRSLYKYRLVGRLEQRFVRLVASLRDYKL